MASEETVNISENNLTITFSSNTSHKSLSTKLIAPWIHSYVLTKPLKSPNRSCRTTKNFISLCLPTLINLLPKLLGIYPILSQGKAYFWPHDPLLFSCHYLSSLVQCKSTFLHHAGYIAAVKNCCASMIVKWALFAIRVASRVLGAWFNTIIFYMCNVIVFRHLVQHKAVATEFILEHYSYYMTLYITNT